MSRNMKPSHMNSRSTGFSLVEVMVAVLVISIGLLGIAKMQALALSSTGNARLRALASLEAASLATTIRANRGYWASSATVGVDLNVTLTGTTLAATEATLTAGLASIQGGNSCSSVGDGANVAPCAPALLAAYDLTTWAKGLNALIPSDSGVINCTQPNATTPVTCTVRINWTENQVAANTGAAAGPVMSMPQYTLYVEP
jgi:type IV pilus assembly protein PilV